MTRHIAESEPGHHAERLKETVASLFESFGLKARAAKLSDL